MSQWDKFFKNANIDLTPEGQLAIVANKKYKWHLQRLLKKIEREAQQIVRTENNKYSKTGNLAKSIKSDGVYMIKGGRGRMAGTVSAGGVKAPYAWAVHDGAKPHIITARPDNPTGMLRFMWEGRTGRVSQSVFIVAKNRSKNSREYGTNIGGLNAYTTNQNDSDSRARMAAGLGGVAAYEKDTKQRAFGKEVRRRGKRNGVQNTETIASRRYMRVEQRWGRGRLKDKLVITRSVNHPGYKGNPFLKEATRRVMLNEFGWNTNWS